MKESGLQGGLLYLCEWIAKFAVTNLLWFLFNLPMFFICLCMILAEKQSTVFFLTVPLFILAPVLFFPATAALYASVREWLTNEDENPPLVKGYIIQYKTNYKKSLQAGLLISFIWAVWLGDYIYFSKVNLVFTMFFFFLGIILAVFTINFFSVNAHYHLNVRSLLKQALFYTVGRPRLFIIVALSTALILYVSFYKIPLAIPVFAASLIAFITFSAFYRHFLNITKQLN